PTWPATACVNCTPLIIPADDASLWAHFVRNEMRRTQCAAKRGAPGMARNRALFRTAKCADLRDIQRRQ
ncbi:MAG: hypothetical protein JJU22_16865, partial [Gammaproteobacteria bacterium]|nr:hypothetical protein [Gammaproteobacteria bacterium]